MTPQEYLTATKSFSGSDHTSFVEHLTNGLDIIHMAYADLAYEMNVLTTTVRDWIDGVYASTSLQKIAIAIIRSRVLDIQLTSKVPEDTVSPIATPPPANVVAEDKVKKEEASQEFSQSIFRCTANLYRIECEVKDNLKTMAMNYKLFANASDVPADMIKSFGYIFEIKDELIKELNDIETKFRE